MDKRIIELAEYNSEETVKKKFAEEIIEAVVADEHEDNWEYALELADVFITGMERAVQRGIPEEMLEEAFDFKLDRSIKRKEEGTL